MEMASRPIASQIDEAAIPHLARAAGITIPAERVAGAAERLNNMLEFLAELEAVDAGTIAPAAEFDPAWDETR
jgi:Asp-tRNA(Asn)/Glu-tRNA(Gln) amidotransferase C subunit